MSGRRPLPEDLGAVPDETAAQELGRLTAEMPWLYQVDHPSGID
ncbi:hypothetical protein [Embleya sp. NPDC050493]